jgi:hypothetical protein
MFSDIPVLRPGLVLSMLTLLLGIGMGILFGVNEDGVKDYINEGVYAHAQVHDQNSQSKIWRYAQRAHFHATGVGGFALGMILLVGATPMTRRLKATASTLIGVGSLYPLAWLSMFLLAPSIGRGAAHDALITQTITQITVFSLLVGLGVLLAHLLFGFGTSHLQHPHQASTLGQPSAR